MRTKLLLLTGLLLGIAIQLSAYSYQRVDSTQAEDYKVVHIREASVPWDIYVMEIDLTKTNLTLKAGLANDQVAFTYPNGTHSVQKETLAHMINRRNTAGENVLGGINADFFDMTSGRQFNVTATGGVIASTGITSIPHAAIYTDENGVPYIHLIEMQHTMTITGGGDRTINGVNSNRWADHLVLYNRFTGSETSFANQWGTELLLEALGDSYLNGTHDYKVIRKAANVTRTSDDQIIASGHGTAVPYLNNAIAGDIIQISTSFTGIGNEKIYEMIGGWGHIVKDGINNAVAAIEQEGSMMHENDRHPRSAVGYNADKSKLYLVAVDGRSTLSAGMNLDELANFMIDGLGVYDGLNFDGGGSTTLMGGDQTYNAPSGGVQRAIANALLVVKEAATAIHNIPTARQVSLFPNPVREFVQVSWQGNVAKVCYFEVFDMLGRPVFSRELGSSSEGENTRRVELPHLKSGTYLYRLTSGGVSKGSGKFMVQ